MVGIRTIAALVGVLAGAWAALGTYYGWVGGACAGFYPCSGPAPNFYMIALGVLLALNSVVCIFGPSKIFYASAGLSILLGGTILPSANLNYVGEAGFLLAVLSLVLSLYAARRVSGVSEQSHPMNLPVFG